jgi:hypothetical protein
MLVLVNHEGRVGDGDEELARLRVRLRDGSGEVLTAGQAEAVLESLSVWKDVVNDGDPFDPEVDLELVSLTDFSGVDQGELTLQVPDDEPEAAVPFAVQGAFFLVAETAAGASGQGISILEVTLYPAGAGPEEATAEDRDHDLPLRPEHAPESIVEVRLVGLIFADGFESGDLSAWSTSVP